MSEQHTIITLQENINEFISKLIKDNDGKLTEEVWENDEGLNNILVRWYYHVFLEEQLKNKENNDDV